MQSEILKLTTNLERRNRSGKRFILIPMKNFNIKSNPLDPILEGYITSDATYKLRDYFLRDHKLKHLPFHFLVNANKQDRWKVVNGCPLDVKSDLLSDAITNNLISSIYPDDIVIAIQDDFYLSNPDPTMYEIIAYNIIKPISYITGNNRDVLNRVIWFDEIFNFKEYEEYYVNSIEKRFGRLSNKNYKYNAIKSNLFDRTIMEIVMKKFI